MLTQEEIAKIKNGQGESNGPSPKSDAIISRYTDAGIVLTEANAVKDRTARLANIASLAPGALDPAHLLARIEALEAKGAAPAA